MCGCWLPSTVLSKSSVGSPWLLWLGNKNGIGLFKSFRVEKYPPNLYGLPVRHVLPSLLCCPDHPSCIGLSNATSVYGDLLFCLAYVVDSCGAVILDVAECNSSI